MENINKKTNRGQGLLPVIITGGFAFLASVGAAWLTASRASSENAADLNTKVEVVKTTEDLHYKEVQRQLGELGTDVESVNRKLDAIISAWKIPVK